MHAAFVLENQNRRGKLEDIGTDERIILIGS
jgi:hypothetical protein